MLTILNYDGTYISVAPAVLWSVLATIIAVLIVFYLLRSFGVYCVAKRQQLKFLWLSFIPVGWLILFTKVSGDIIFFGKRIKKSHFLVFAVGLVMGLLNTITTILAYLPLVGYAFQGGEILLNLSSAKPTGWELYWTGGVYVRNIVYPYANANALATAINVINYVNYVVDIAFSVLMIFVYSNFFRKYLPGHNLIATILSVFGLSAPFIFAVRKNLPVNYADYVRAKYQRFSNPYGAPQNNVGQDPFSNMDSSNDKSSPFDEFEDKKDKSDSDDPFSDF